VTTERIGAALKISELEIRRWTAGLIALLWLVSLCFPVWEKTVPGVWLLLTGWIGAWALDFGWFANVVLVFAAGLLTEARRRPWALVAVGILLSWSFCAELMRTSLPAFAADHEGTVGAWRAGFYLWISAVGIGAVAALVSGRLALREREGKAE
jgi:hypothetical protein